MGVGVYLLVKFRAFRVTVATVEVCKRVVLDRMRIDAVYDEAPTGVPAGAWVLMQRSGVTLKVWAAG